MMTIVTTLLLWAELCLKVVYEDLTKAAYLKV